MDSTKFRLGFPLTNKKIVFQKAILNFSGYFNKRPVHLVESVILNVHVDKVAKPRPLHRSPHTGSLIPWFSRDAPPLPVNRVSKILSCGAGINNVRKQATDARHLNDK